VILIADTIMDIKATTTDLVDVEDTVMDIPMVTRRLILISELLLSTLLETCFNQ
jgi:hypothetical protein